MSQADDILETQRFLDTDTIRKAIDQLCSSERGTDALESLNIWLSLHGSGLDAKNQSAILTLMRMFWFKRPGTTREMIQEAVGNKPIRCEHGVPENDWCEPCNKAYKDAAKAAGLGD